MVHYIIHSCDNPAMAKDGLAAAEHYGEIAPSGAHAAHMPGHIFARLGMWPQDIDAQLASIHASEAAQAHGENGIMDEPHSYDFLMYAYLQSGQDAKAKAVLEKSGSVMDRMAGMPDMTWMNGYYRTKFPVFYALETRDWQTAAALKPIAGAPPEDEAMTWWAHAIADGHLHHAEQAKADLAKYDVLMAEVKKGSNAYEADSTAAQITRNETAAWASFASDKQEDALQQMRQSPTCRTKSARVRSTFPPAKCWPTCCSNSISRNRRSPSIA